MSGLTWTLRRLAAMGPAEVWHRTAITLRDRVPPRWAGLAPERAAAELFEGGAAGALATSRLAAFVRAVPEGARMTPVLDEARALAHGRWSAFGCAVALDDPPRWSCNPWTGACWPSRPARAIDHRRADLAGDPKYTWEAGRLTMLPDLALAARVTNDRTHADRALRWLADFAATNPLGHGIHHTSGIEQAVRVLTTTWTLALLDERPAVQLAGPLGLLAQQALWCRDHRSLGSSANNHLLAEYAAMAVAGAAFPALRGAERLVDAARAGVARELPRQIHADGVTAEQAFGYLPFVWELVLSTCIACEAAGRTVPEPVRARLAASLEFARAIRLPGGGTPHVGDEDDGRILLAADGAAWLGAPALSDADALALLLTGRTSAPGGPPEGRVTFADGGYTVWRQGPWLVTFDHGPLGLGSLAAHGHADALSVTLHHGDRAVIADPGTFSYHADPARRDRCRRTPAHATLHFGDGSQSEPRGPFLWGAPFHVAPEGAGYRCTWANGRRHWRAFDVTPARVTIEDRAAGPDAVVAFPLGPGAEVTLDGPAALVRVGSARVRFTAEGLEPWRIEPGEVAERFARPVAAPRLVAGLRGTAALTRIDLTQG
jgi:heparinase II/III-like protein